jgi:hypothetical protein
MNKKIALLSLSINIFSFLDALARHIAAPAYGDIIIRERYQNDRPL